MKLETGIPKLDELLDGGIKKNKSILLYSTPGVENLEFAQQILHYRLNKGDHGMYFVNNKKPITVRYMLKKYCWNLDRYEKKGKFSFFDCYSGLISQKSSERFYVKKPLNLNEIKKEFFKAIKEMENDNILLVFDALSSLLDLCGTNKDVFGCLSDCLLKVDELKITPVFLFTQWPYEKNIIKKIRGLFDCIIDLKAVERKVILRKYFTISKANWLDRIEKREVPFKIFRPGGVKVYIPKILVTGPFNAGKTSFIHSASTKAVSVDRLGTTVALDRGHVDYKGFAVDLFGTPGQERFDPILKLIGSESLGVVIVIDSTNPNSFVRAKDMLEKTKTEGLPFIVIANKANLKGALKPEQIRKKMELPEEIPIVTVVAKNLKKVKKGRPCKLREQDIARVLDKLFDIII